MPTINPFADNIVKAETWQQGYLAGFAEPDIEHFRPFTFDLLEVYRGGDNAGRNDRRAAPSGGGVWVDNLVDLIEHVTIHVVGAALEKFIGAAGGLAALVVTVVTIPGDVQLKPLPPEFRGLSDQPGDTYVAVCPRNDHPIILEGATAQGFWTGTGHSAFADAAADMQAHTDAEAFVARCSLTDNTCGVVWAVK
jgi:hypothetical protein